jgi:HK97 family phage major capsid protein/HK97 family phage prohead protease
MVMGINGQTLDAQKIKATSYGRSQTLELKEEDRSGSELTFSFSSEKPVERWWGKETLLHEKDSAILDRLNDRGAFLFNHNRNILLGSTLKAWIEDDKRAYVTTRWSSRSDIDGYRQDLEEGHLTHVSFAYDILEWIEQKDSWDITVTRWEAFEVSLVTIPADPTVGIGRDRERPLLLGMEQPIIVMPFAQESRSHSGRFLNEAKVRAETPTEEEPEEEEPADEEPEEESAKKKTATTAAFDLTIDSTKGESTMKIEEILETERQRAKAIRILGEEHNCRDVAEEFVNGGNTIEEFRAVVLDKILQMRQEPIATPAKPLGLSEKEQCRYSVVKALNAAISRDWKGAEFELECSRLIEDQRGKDPGPHGFYIPVYDLRVQRDAAQAGRQERATYQVGTPNLGGLTVETELYPEMIDYLRNVPLVAQFGARFWSGLTGNLDILRQLTYSNVGWIGEDQALPEGNATFGTFGLRPKDVGAWSRITRRMLQQNSIDIENFVREELMIGIALEIDRAAIHGSGVGFEPRGITNTPGVGSIALGVNGGVPTWDSVVRLETLVSQSNALMANVAYMTTPAARGKLKTTPKSTSFVSEFIWQDSGVMTPSGNLGILNGYRAGATNQVRGDLTKGTGTNLSTIVFGNWSEVIIGEWGYMFIDVNPYGDDDFLKDAIKVKAIHTLDIQVGRPNGFAVVTDLSTGP